MAETPVIQSPGTALAERPVTALLRPIAKPSEVLVAQEETRKLVKEILVEGRDYGSIPGVDKPSLLKPGAERVGMAFGCFPRYRILEKEIDHDRVVPWNKRKKKWRNQFNGDREFTWEEQSGTSYGLYRYVVDCEIVHRDSGQVVGHCIGVCSTMESKYVDRPRDAENTVLKIAEKRAHVGAALNAFGLSEQFTQDVEENAEVHQQETKRPPVKTSFTLDEAAAFPFPFKRGTPMNGKPLSELATKHLESIRDWIREKQQEDESFHQDTIAAINVVLEARANDPRQAKLPLPVDTRSEVVTDDELEEDGRRHAGVVIADDDLPF